MKSKIKKHLLLLLFFVLYSNLWAQDSIKQIEVNWQEVITKMAIEELRQSGTPSLQIAIGFKDSILFENAYGLADIENNVKATIKTKYRTASVSKLWTATLTMMLVNQGKLNLDTPIQKYCSYFPEKDFAISTRQILTHTSGIRHYADYETQLSKATNAIDSMNVERSRMKDKLGTFTRYTNLSTPLDNFKNDPLKFKPGTDWLYTSFGYRVLGCIIEGASGKSYISLMDELFQTANMENTTVDDAWAIVPNRASGYRIESDRAIRKADMRDVSENLPAGGHLTTASDLIRFVQAFYHEKFIDETSIKLMSTPYSDNLEIDTPSSWRDAIPSEHRYGHGVMIFPDGKTRKIGHTGRQAGASAIVYLIPESELSIAVMSNSKGWNGYITFTKKIEKVMTELLVD